MNPVNINSPFVGQPVETENGEGYQNGDGYQVDEGQSADYQIDKGPITDPEVFLSDITGVGTSKLLGYLPLSTIEKCKVDSYALKRESEERGMKAVFLTVGQETFLYVYDPGGLQDFLNFNTDTLTKNNWPTDASQFVEYVGHEYAETRALYDLVARAFNDPSYR